MTIQTIRSFPIGSIIIVSGRFRICDGTAVKIHQESEQRIY